MPLYTLHIPSSFFMTVSPPVAGFISPYPLTTSRVASIRMPVNLPQSPAKNFLAAPVTHSPARAIPTELLQEIFGHCRVGWEDRLDRRRGSLRLHAEPWNISQVSRRWRNVVLGTPELWSSVRVCYSDFEEQPHDAVLYRLELQLQRSKSQTLSVSVVTSKHCELPETVHFRIRSQLVAYASQWAELYLLDETHTLHPLFHPLLPEVYRMSALNHVDLQTAAEESIKAFAFEDVTNLRHVDVQFVNHCQFNGTFRISIPWGRVATCALRAVPAFGASQLLGQLQNVEQLFLSTADLALLPMPSGPQRFQLLHLHTLTLDLHCRTANWFILRLRAPSLRVFKAPASTALLPSISTFLAFSSCALTSIHITDIRADHDLTRFAPILRLCRSSLLKLHLTMLSQDVDVRNLAQVIPQDDFLMEGQQHVVRRRVSWLVISANVRYGSRVKGEMWADMVEGFSRIIGSRGQDLLRMNLSIEGFDGWSEDVLQRMRTSIGSERLELRVAGRMAEDMANPMVMARQLIP